MFHDSLVVCLPLLLPGFDYFARPASLAGRLLARACFGLLPDGPLRGLSWSVQGNDTMGRDELVVGGDTHLPVLSISEARDRDFWNSLSHTMPPIRQIRKDDVKRRPWGQTKNKGLHTPLH